MRVTIDATAALIRSAGVKSYVYHLVRQLRRLEQGEEIRAYPFIDDLGSLDHQGSSIGEVGTLARIALVLFANARGNPAIDWLLRGTDVFHASNQVRRGPHRAKLTATLHDLTCWIMPQVHTPANILADQRFADNILRQADALIAVSENTRQDAIRVLGIPPERIETIHSGVAEEYFDAVPMPREKPYVLFVGTIEPRKNIETLLDAWRDLSSDLRREFDLVIAGPVGWKSEAIVARIRSEAAWLGYVPESQLPGLTAGATMLAYPSLYEGFGFPVAQAMAARVAVLTSNSSCLPEVTAGGALLVDPLSPAEIAAGLTRLLTSESERSRLALLGRKRAEQYRWEECATRTLMFFRRVASTL
jgi:glycosyltransferase involved in cell wall biosynthesis